MRQALAAAVILLASAATARADAMRCGTHLITDQATLAQTLSECGKPARHESRVERAEHGVADKHGNVTIFHEDVQVDLLRYDFGPHEFLYQLVFRNGQMASMQKIAPSER